MIRQNRRRERQLLMVAAVFIGLNQITLALVQGFQSRMVWPMLVWVIGAWILYRVLGQQLPHHDPYLLPAMMFLTGWGLNLVTRLAPAFSNRQTAWLAVSVTLLVGLVRCSTNLQWLKRYHYQWLVVGMSLLAATIAYGVNPSGFGPRLWLGSSIYFQPSELLKVVMVAFLAGYFADHWVILRQQHIPIGHRLTIPSPAFFTPVLLMFGLCMVLLIWQRDLGAATIFFVVFLVMLYIASGQWLLLVGGGSLLLVAAMVGYLLFDVVALRVDIWLNPWQEPDGRSFQIVQSLMAVAAGGVSGTGIGQGLPTFIPVVHSDFAFAAIAEEWGLVGVFGLIVALAVLIFRGIRLAILNQDKPFMALLAAGLSLLLATQSILIMGGTLRLWPLTGVTLPFVSYGGSSLLISFIIVGLLLMISEETWFENSAT